MSDFGKNTHAESAECNSSRSADPTQVRASLGIAYELRTANLIALLAARVTTGDGRDLARLDAMIESRLGL